MEEVAAPRKDDDRQLLRPRPREHVGERHDVVLLAVDDDRVGRDRRRAEPLHRRADQHEALGDDSCGEARLHERPEREPREHDGELAGSRCRVGKRRARVVGFTRAVVEGSFASADAAEVERGC